jgi:hypothetical protein
VQYSAKELSHGTRIGMGSKIVAMCPCRHGSGDIAPVREAAVYPRNWGNGAVLNTHSPCFEWHSSKSANVQSSLLKFKADLAPEFLKLHLHKFLGEYVCRAFDAINK